jgi:hemolysin activation/secretion protein
MLARGSGALVLSIGSASVALAQAIPVPSPALPGRLERQFAPPPELAPALPPLPLPELPAAPQQPPSGIAFVLKDVVVEGSTVYTQDELSAAYAPFLGREISIEQLPQIEQALTVLYRRDGYILSRAVVDAQTIDPQAGVLHVKIYEGYIDKIRLDPLDYEVSDQGALLRAILQHVAHGCRSGEEAKGDKPCPLHRDVLERYLLLANDLPGVQASAVIQPSVEAEGGADLFVTVNETPVGASASIDNRGSAYVGPLTAHESATFNDIFGLFERTELRAAHSIPFNELELVNGVEEIPLTSDGLRLALDFTHTRSRPGGLLRPINLETLGDSGGFTLAYPYLRTRSENLQLRASIEIRNSITTHGLSDATAFYDRSRVATFGASYDLADRWLGVNLVDVSVGQGIPTLGATPPTSISASHTGANPAFTKLNGEISRVQQVLPSINVLGAATGQYAFSKLLSAEQFGYGGDRYGHAYDPSEVLGDRGVAAKAERQYTPDWAAGMMGWNDGVRALQFYIVGDVGRAWVDPGPSTHLSGASLGGGVRFTITDYLAGYVEVAKPLTRRVQAVQAKGAGGKEPRFFFSVAGKF